MVWLHFTSLRPEHKLSTSQLSLIRLSEEITSVIFLVIKYLVFIRNKFFIKSPGRDLGGFLSFIQGFRLGAWLASVVFLITMPLVFFIIFKILVFFDLQEVREWSVGWNLFAVTGAIVQQVRVISSCYSLKKSL